MITGDYPATATAIAGQAGLDTCNLVTGEQLEKMSTQELEQGVRTTTVFARIMPDQKLRIVSALKTNGEIVAMTGDGVNDAPSLKAAHIGIAMGGRGTDVAREASSIVLLDDDFGSIVRAIRLGRRIYDNLRKAMGFIFAVHVPIAGLAILPLLFGLPILFWPMHIAFLEMIIDPVCSLVFEAETEEDDVMNRPPRPPDQPLFSGALIGWSLVAGNVRVCTCRRDLHHSVKSRHAGGGGASAGFLLAGTGHCQSDFRQSLLQCVAHYGASATESSARMGAAGSSCHAEFDASLSAHKRAVPLHLDDLALTFGAGVLVLVFLEALKFIWRRRLSFSSQNRGTRFGSRPI
jgi:Ca2+-transporting ATPase